MQKLLRQINEDGDLGHRKWAPDRLDSDTEDPDSEDFVAIPKEIPRAQIAKGNTSGNPIKDWTDDDDSDDCQIIEVLDPKPLRSMPPADMDVPTSDAPAAAAGGQGKKRATTGTKAGAAGPPKRRKKTRAAGPRERPAVIA